jgi:hypothetical protein
MSQRRPMLSPPHINWPPPRRLGQDEIKDQSVQVSARIKRNIFQAQRQRFTLGSCRPAQPAFAPPNRRFMRASLCCRFIVYRSCGYLTACRDRQLRAAAASRCFDQTRSKFFIAEGHLTEALRGMAGMIARATLMRAIASAARTDAAPENNVTNGRRTLARDR